MNKMNNEMIPLTIADTLDQSMKTRVEVPDTTVKQAVKHANLAPKGNYDVYDSAGVIISNNNTRNYRDSTVYVGVPKVAGGAPIEFDDDWDEDGIDLDNFPNGRSNFVIFRDLEMEKHKVETEANETLYQLAKKSGILPKDGTYITILDGNGDDSSKHIARTQTGRIFNIVRKRIEGGAGIPIDRLNELASDYPSLLPVRMHTNNKYTEMVTVRFPSNGKTSSGFWKVAIHCPNAKSGLPHAYILNNSEIKKRPRKAAIYSGNPPTYVSYGRGASTNLPGTNATAHWLCHGDVLPSLNQIGNDPIKRMNAYVNHVINLLNE